MIHSHHNLPEIFHYMWRLRTCAKGSFTDLVFRLVMFHQSVEGLEKYPPMIALTKVEKYRYLDPDFYKMLTILMIADSCSYTIIDTQISREAREEFMTAQASLLAQWDEVHQS